MNGNPNSYLDYKQHGNLRRTLEKHHYQSPKKTQREKDTEALIKKAFKELPDEEPAKTDEKAANS